MRASEEAEASAKVWLEHAARDLRAARALSDLPDLAGNVCFHAQQAGEKGLKALLAWLSEEHIPKTHDLTELEALVVCRGGPRLPRGNLRTLSQHAVASRYPEVEQPTDQEAAQAVEMAEELLELVREAVGISED